jgi:hypothetical protein
MILSGDKKEEYREVKPYWINRLTWHEYHGRVNIGDLIYDKKDFFNRSYDAIKFTNGYGSKAPFFIIELLEITVGNGDPEWGFTDCCFILKLGKLIEAGNVPCPINNSRLP